MTEVSNADKNTLKLKYSYWQRQSLDIDYPFKKALQK
jgi:hypothetical protein